MMDITVFWESVAALRRAEAITLVITMIVPLLSGSILFTLRHRIKTLQRQSLEIQEESHQGETERLARANRRLEQDLENVKKETSALRQMTAPRSLTPLQEDILLENLRGVQSSPVIVSAYAFEEESAVYAIQIAAVLRKANWDVTVNKASMNDFKGISFGTINLMHRPLSGMRELAQAFQRAHLDFRQRDILPDSIAGPLQDGSLLIVVGRK
jgi:hypothetical protein